MKKTQEKIIIHNSFFELLLIFVSFFLNIIRAFRLFFFGDNKTTTERYLKSKIHKIMYFFTLQWPKNFGKAPNIYNGVKLIGDFIHHIFLKK